MSINNIDIDRNIDKIADTLGMEGERTVLKLKKYSDAKDKKSKNKRVLELQSGDFNSKKPWFIIDEDNRVHPLVSVELLMTFLNATRDALQENLNIRLEQAIIQELPIDYNDVLAVAMNEVGNIINSPKEKSIVNLNVDGVVQTIKKRHPNLFYNMDMNEMVSKEDL